MKKTTFLVVCLLLSWFSIINSWSQNKLLSDEWIAARSNDFKSPLTIPLALAGNFGECRPNHFHTGLDFKTNQKENLRVNAVADGYVSRISMSHTGYGHCLYIDHPNGLTTVYAHLNTFSKEIEEYLLQAQSDLEQWNIHLDVPPGYLPVQQGAMIALSGNTGGSMAPHLHFEVRKTGTNLSINPFHFQAFRVKDQIAPQLIQVGIYNAQQSLYQQSPTYHTPIKSGTEYMLQATVPHEKVYLSFLAKDFMNNSQNWLGIYSFQLFKDDELFFETQINSIDLSKNRMMNAYIDYSQYRISNNMFQLAYILPNNSMSLYPLFNSNGSIQLNPNTTTSIKVIIKDYFNNSSTLSFNLKYEPIDSTASDDAPLALLIPGEATTINQEYFWLSTSKHSFYDTVYFNTQEVNAASAFSKAYQISSPIIPIHEGVQLGLRLTQPLPMALRSKLIFLNEVKGSQLPGRARQSAIPATFEKGFAVAEIQNFGQFEVSIDTIPPKIKIISSTTLKKGQTLIIEAQEELTYLSDFRAYDSKGYWMNMRRSKNSFYFTIPKDWASGSHEIEVLASDANQNTLRKTFILQIHP